MKRRKPMTSYKYFGRELSDYSLQELKNILNHFNDLLLEREKSSTHDKFTIGTNGKPPLAFPPPNPEFLKLKNEIEKVINNA